MKTKTVDALRSAYDGGLTAKQVREQKIANHQTLQRFERATGVRFPRDKRGSKPTSDKKAPAMAALYRAGYTLHQIGEEYGITRERVRQILRAYTDVTRQEGGGAVLSAARNRERDVKRDARYMKRYGCTYDQLARVRAKHSSRPTRAFSQQKHNAARRGIGWDLTFWQWWTIWQQSGKWSQRGRGQGYVMCRVGDEGAYAIGNVFIALSIENTSNRKGKTSGLPTGVTRRGRRYAAHRMIGGKKRRLGAYDTPSQAHAAYLMAGEPA